MSQKSGLDNRIEISPVWGLNVSISAGNVGSSLAQIVEVRKIASKTSRIQSAEKAPILGGVQVLRRIYLFDILANMMTVSNSSGNWLALAAAVEARHREELHAFRAQGLDEAIE